MENKIKCFGCQQLFNEENLYEEVQLSPHIEPYSIKPTCEACLDKAAAWGTL